MTEEDVEEYKAEITKKTKRSKGCVMNGRDILKDTQWLGYPSGCTMVGISYGMHDGWDILRDAQWLGYPRGYTMVGIS